MARKDEITKYSGQPADLSTDDFSLEDILAEYGGGQERKLMRDVERELDPLADLRPRKSVLLPKTPEVRKERKEAPKPPKQEEPEFPQPPRPVTLQDVVGSTVSAVMEEADEPILQPRRGLFSRRKMEETEELYDSLTPPPQPEPEPLPPEPDLYEAAAKHREQYRKGKQGLIPALLIALLPTGLMVAEQYGLVIPLWTGDLRFQSIVLLTCLMLNMLLCRGVFKKGFKKLANKRCVSELLTALAALVSAADCVVCLMESTARTAAPHYGMAAALALVFAQWGIVREHRANYDMFRTAAIDEEPPYLVTDTEKGACKQRGSVSGFYTTARKDDAATVWQTILLPVVLMASLVFAGLGSLGQGRNGDFFLNWSVILTAGATFSLPLCWPLPWARLAKQLQKAGCAVAGWAGAEKISRRRCMIVTDGDLFPPGTMQLNGVKVFGEELRVAVSHAATMARAAGSGLERLFDGLLRSELGHYETVSDFSFYTEGGWSASIRGESLLMGTASFMRKMDVRLPGDINLKTGIFLAVDGQLVAVFAVKYKPSENVDFALRLMRRTHITPILAARDPNITPALLQRKFHKGVRVEFPDIISRVALSEAEKDRDLPRALLFREGLLPYAEVVTGSRRMCQAVRRALMLSLFGSVVGTLLTFYLTFQSAYGLLHPLALEVFLLLWTLPALLLSDWCGRA